MGRKQRKSLAEIGHEKKRGENPELSVQLVDTWKEDTIGGGR